MQPTQQRNNATNATNARLGAARYNAPHRLPDDVAALLAAFDLHLGGILTTSSAKAAHTTAAGVARSAMHYALPHRALARAIDPRNVDAPTAPRAYIASLHALANAYALSERAAAYNACLYATPGCAAACLHQAGHGGLSVDVVAARGRRSLAMLADPITYARAVAYAVAAQLQRAARKGMPLALRMNGTTEAPWFAQRLPLSATDAARIRRRYGVDVETGDALTLAEAFAADRERGALVLYEYLKAPVDAPDGLRAWSAAGWDVTASFAADRSTAVRDAVAAVRAGFRVAFPVALQRGAAPLRSVTLETDRGDVVTLPAVDGDATDARYADAPGAAVILREKRARGADRAVADRFILPDAPRVALSDGAVLLTR